MKFSDFVFTKVSVLEKLIKNWTVSCVGCIWNSDDFFE